MNAQRAQKICLGEPCRCESEANAMEMQPPPRRTKLSPLGFPGSDGELSEESLAYDHFARVGDLEVFMRYNPEQLLIERENRQQEIEVIEEVGKICNAILTELTERQKQILYLRADDWTFKEIGKAMNLCDRSIYYEWGKIRQKAYDRIPQEDRKSLRVQCAK